MRVPTTPVPWIVVLTPALVPMPVSVRLDDATFAMCDSTQIVTSAESGASAESSRIAEYFAAVLRRSTGLPLPVVTGQPTPGNIYFDAAGAGADDESYLLEVTTESVRLTARESVGLFRGVQTLRQLLPAQIEASSVQSGPWTIPAGTIVDRPRFGWRGSMLDVSRHFFGVADIKRYLDDITLYKINVLHLHLSDDQGWRIEIEKWPRLTEVGSASEVGDGAGGFYTKSDYAEIVAYATERFITIVPEIDMPGHTNAALTSYAELNCSGVAPEPYRGIEVGFSALCGTSDATWHFVDDVFTELAAMTPGDYLHIGGDEVHTLSAQEYAGFVERVEQIVIRTGKRAVGWGEIGKAQISPTTVLQHWNTTGSDDVVHDAIARGAKVLMSPASKTYLDLKYDESTELGLTWAGLIDVLDAWDWDPATLIDGVGAEHIVGIEAPIWTETMTTIADVEFMAFPRLPALAEVGWSAAEGRDWDDFRARLAAHGPRWDAMSLGYYHSPQIDW